MSQPFPDTLDVFADGFTKSQVDIIDAVSQGRGIQDPTATARVDCVSSLSRVRSQINGVLSQFTVGSGLGEISTSTVILNDISYNGLSAISHNISALISNIDTYREHSERISGLTGVPDGSTLPDFSSLVGLATSFNLTKASIDKAKGRPVVDNFSLVFNSIVGDAQNRFALLKNESDNAFNNIKEKGRFFSNPYNSLITDSSTKFKGISAGVDSFAAQDMNNFNTIVDFLNKVSKGTVIAGLAGQENTHTRFLVDNFVGGPELKEFLRKADEESNQRVLF